MKIPFTVEQFFGVFYDYNIAVWSAQVFLVALAVIALVLLVAPQTWAGVAVSRSLVFLWARMALTRHLAFFSSITRWPTSLQESHSQAPVFLLQGVLRRWLEFTLRAATRTPVGFGLIFLALVLHHARANALLDNILLASARAQCLRSDAAIGKYMQRMPLELIRAPTRLVSARDEGYGTYASAQYTPSQISKSKFVGFDHGGPTWVGRDDEIRAEIFKLLAQPTARQPGTSGK